MQFFMVLSILISSLYTIIVLISVDSDLKTFLDEIDMLQIQALFMGPFDEFMCTRFTLFVYRNSYNAGEMSAETLEFLSPFPKSRLASGYEDLKVNFNIQLKNPSLN